MLHKNRYVAKAGGSLVQSARVIYIEEGRQGVAVQEKTPAAPRNEFNQSDIADHEDDAMTETSRTDDDPVGDAFRQVLDGSDRDIDIEEDQEDEIVWNPR